jgi:hypothetical protein
LNGRTGRQRIFFFFSFFLSWKSGAPRFFPLVLHYNLIIKTFFSSTHNFDFAYLAGT